MKIKIPDKKQSRKTLERKLDDLWREGIRIRDKGIDQYSFLTTGIPKPGYEAHHIFSRAHKCTKWDLNNGILLQRGHNYSPAHKDYELFRKFLIEKWFKSEEKYQALWVKSHLGVHYYVSDLELIYKDLKRQVEMIKGVR